MKRLRSALHGRACAMGAALTFALLAAPSFGGAAEQVGGRDTSADRRPDAAAAARGLEVTELQSFVWQQNEPTDSHLMVWVNLTNPGTEPVTNLTGELRGAETAIVFQAIGDQFQGTVGRGLTASHSFYVLPRTQATVHAQIQGNAPFGAIALEVTSPAGDSYTAPASSASLAVQVPLDDVNAGAFSLWTAAVSHTSGFRGISYQVWVEFTFTDAFENVTLDGLPPGATYRLYYNIWAEEPYPTMPNLTITINATVAGAGGDARVSYVVGVKGPATEVPLSTGRAGGGMQVAAVAVVVGSAAAVALLLANRKTRWLRLPGRLGGKRLEPSASGQPPAKQSRP